MTDLDERAVQPYGFELDAFVAHVHVEIAVAGADGAVAFDDPAVEVVERGGERHRVADELAVARGLILGTDCF